MESSSERDVPEFQLADPEWLRRQTFRWWKDHKVDPFFYRVGFGCIEFHRAEAQKLDRLLDGAFLKINTGDDDGIEFIQNRLLRGVVDRQGGIVCTRGFCPGGGLPGLLGLGHAEEHQQRKDGPAGGLPGEACRTMGGNSTDAGFDFGPSLEDSDEAEAECP